MKQIAVRLAALVIIASIVPVLRIGAQGQNVITSRVTDESWRYFPCASGVIEKRETAPVQKRHSKGAVRTGERKRSRRAERRL